MFYVCSSCVWTWFSLATINCENYIDINEYDEIWTKGVKIWKLKKKHYIFICVCVPCVANIYLACLHVYVDGD